MLTLNKKDINPRIAQWALELQAYDYSVEHRSGSHMKHVDALSRVCHILVIEDNAFELNLSLCQSKDPKIKLIHDELEKRQSNLYEMRNGIIYKKGQQTLILRT